MYRKYFLVLLVVIFMLTGIACTGPQAVATETQTEVPTETPTPTEMPTATPDLAATAAYEATQASEVLLGEIGEVLAKVNLTTDNGHIAWVEKGPMPIQVSTAWEERYLPVDDGIVYKTYVLHTDMIWESTGGLAGCGIIFHSENNIKFGKQYRFFTIRLSGLPLWDVELWQHGRWQSTTTGQAKTNGAINQDNGAVNNIILVVQKGVMAVYANGTRLSNVIIGTGSEGRVAFFGSQESGQTTCTFENNWIWVLDE